MVDGPEQELAIFGAGSWGTAVAIHLAEAGRRVTLWGRRAEAVARLQATRCNEAYLPDAAIPEAVTLTHDLEAAARAPVWVVAAPSHAVRALAETLRPHVAACAEAHGAPPLVVSLAKGIENGTLMTTTQVLADVLSPAVPTPRIGVLYGPSHAEEVAGGAPTTVVAAAPVPATCKAMQRLFMTDRLRVYANADVRGVEVGGSVKNVLALAAGISDGVGYGDNAKAALITRGLAEMRRLGVAMGAWPATFAGLAGIGDVVVTCMSRHSRKPPPRRGHRPGPHAEAGRGGHADGGRGRAHDRLHARPRPPLRRRHAHHGGRLRHPLRREGPRGGHARPHDARRQARARPCARCPPPRGLRSTKRYAGAKRPRPPPVRRAIERCLPSDVP